MFKRTFLFLATNLAVLVLAGLVMNFVLPLFGIRLGAGNGPLLVMAAIFGFGGAFFSLAISKWMAKRSMGVRVITQPSSPTESWLVNTVQRLAQQAGIGMPEVGIFDSPEPNAFATGARRDAALVAVSSGLLNNMKQEEVEAVLGHEISHVANGDMVTLTLIQGVLNTFVIFLARVIGGLVDSWLRGDRDREGGGGFAYFIIVMILQTVLGLLASIVVAWFSRYREFRADAGSARLGGPQPMIAALQRLQQAHEPPALPQAVQAFGISGAVGTLFASHPPIEERIAALRQPQA